jgi:hypothetical protein
MTALEKQAARLGIRLNGEGVEAGQGQGAPLLQERPTSQSAPPPRIVFNDPYHVRRREAVRRWRARNPEKARAQTRAAVARHRGAA